jgi:hypothetical protein
VHSIHATNALLLLLGVASTSISALAAHLEVEYGVLASDYEPLILRVQKGDWENKADINDVPSSAHVTLQSVPRAHRSR